MTTKERWYSETKTSRIEWTITREKELAKAVFYIIKPDYHAHPWTACAVMMTPERTEFSSYAYAMDQPQLDALQKCLRLAADFARGKKPAGKKITVPKAA